MQTHEKMTVPNPSAPTDGEQSFRNDATTSIAQYVEKCNTEFSEEEFGMCQAFIGKISFNERQAVQMELSRRGLGDRYSKAQRGAS